jgi:FtsH-binding integral membrane protein
LRSTFTLTLTFTLPVFAEVVTQTYSFDLSAHPRWLVVLVATLIVALVIWIGMKLLKVALWLLFFIVLIGGIAWAVWELIK